MHLIFQHNRLALYCDPKVYGKPLYVEFNKPRYQHISRQELLLKAIGWKKDFVPSVVDLSAGLGSDAYLIYRAGCQLQLVERSPTIAALLQDGLKRAHCDLPLYIGDAKDYLQECLAQQRYPDVIYFDPIFPEKHSHALSQKGARLLRAIAGDDNDAAAVFALALKVAKKRVVVKRALRNPTIDETKPDVVLKGKAIRFDIYLLSHAK